MTYILPQFSGKPLIILPRSQIPWQLEHSDKVLSASSFHYDILAGEYAFTHPHILQDPYHEHVVHKFLPRKMGAMVPSIEEEMSIAFDEIWGVDTQRWKEIGVHDSVKVMIPRAVNRMIVGLPLCRNDDYLSQTAKFATAVVTAFSFLRFTPQCLKPLVGPLVTIPNNRAWRATSKHTLPIIKERLANFQRKKEDPTFEWEEPNDYISWQIAIATAEDRQDELTPDMISRRLMPIDFAAIHTTTLTITNVLFDLIASDPSKHFLEGIREEVERVLAEEGGHWTKAGLGRCHRADSAIRESMRISNFITLSVMRKVLPAEGVENKTEGWRAPVGAYIGLDVYSVHHDPEIYHSPETYDAFRFSRVREEEEDKSPDKDDSEKHSSIPSVNYHKSTSLITTSDTFLSFSHGRHACPGRFFVAVSLKMLLAYMVINYEIEPMETRPPNKWLGSTCLPPMKATIRVRRKLR